MTDVPRLHAVTDAAVLARHDFLARAADLAALGPRVALHVRDRHATALALADTALALREWTAASGAWLVVNARPDLALAVGAEGAQLGAHDLDAADARRCFPALRLGRSVHAAAEARAAAPHADWVLLGTIFASASHPGRAGAGPGLVREAAVGAAVPVIAIGGVTPALAPVLREAGAHGIAAIRALWDAADVAAAARALLAPWEDD